ENNRLTNDLNNVNREIDKLKIERKDYIVSLYQYILDREPEPSEVNHYLNSPYNPIELFNIFRQSQEYHDRIHKQKMALQDAVISLYRYILDREPEPSEVNHHLKGKFNLVELLNNFTQSEEYQDKQKNNKIDLSPILGVAKAVLGEDKPITPNMMFNWYKNAAEALVEEHYNQKDFPKIDEIKNKAFINNSLPTATIVTSLYQGSKFIKAFLENMINQTFFYHCELIIIDANSPENEQEIINEYLKYYSNINYIQLKEKIGIYEAWNLAIQESNSEFITNANIDDLHRHDGLEVKIKALTENPLVDVVYSDVYYSFIANLPFKIAEKCNLRTHLPVANKSNLLKFNSPHNSPMWRRSLHNKLGYFDTSYKSAADYDFWLKAAFSGSSFMKLPKPIVLYYHNPQGMSTKQESPGQIEGENIIKSYQGIFHKSIVE
ncbi:MAG: glycosyltransferase, partial [Crocosphaera sp.]